MPSTDPRAALRAARNVFPTAGLEDLADALDGIADVFGDSMAAMHVGGAFSCTEAERIADVLRLAGHDEAAETWLNGHAEETDERPGDADYDDHHHGRYIRGRVQDRYSELLRQAHMAGRITTEELTEKWKAARVRLADVERFADGRDYEARYELPEGPEDTQPDDAHGTIVVTL